MLRTPPLFPYGHAGAPASGSLMSEHSLKITNWNTPLKISCRGMVALIFCVVCLNDPCAPTLMSPGNGTCDPPEYTRT